MSQQGLRQASVRAESSTTLTYNGDWLALFTAAGFTTGTFNERLLLWLNDWLGESYTSLPAAMARFAEENGATTFSAVGTFDASSGGESGDAGDSLLLFDEGGVTLLHLGMI